MPGAGAWWRPGSCALLSVARLVARCMVTFLTVRSCGRRRPLARAKPRCPQVEEIANLQALAGTRHVFVAGILVVFEGSFPLGTIPFGCLARQPAKMPGASGHLARSGPRIGIGEQSKRIGDDRASGF